MQQTHGVLWESHWGGRSRRHRLHRHQEADDRSRSSKVCCLWQPCKQGISSSLFDLYLFYCRTQQLAVLDTFKEFQGDSLDDTLKLVVNLVPSCQAIFEGLGFSQLANSNERKLRQRDCFICPSVLQSYSSSVISWVVILGNPVNWSAFPDSHVPVIWQGRASVGRTFGQVQENWGSFLHVALVHVVCPVHSRWKTEREDETEELVETSWATLVCTLTPVTIIALGMHRKQTTHE